MSRGWSDKEIIQGYRDPKVLPASREKHGPSARGYVVLTSGNGRQLRVPEGQAVHFLRCANDAVWHREETGEEYCIASLDEVLEILGDTSELVTQEMRERFEKKKFAGWWACYKPHVIRENLPQWAQRLIQKIEGETPAQESSSPHEFSSANAVNCTAGSAETQASIK